MPALYEGHKILPSDILDSRLPPLGNTYYVKKSTDADYPAFFDKFNYVNNVGQNSVQNTITAGMALIQDYDTLIICPGNYDEAGTVTLTGKKGVKILGYSTGMQWSEGATTWNDVTSGADIFKLVSCKGVEVAGIAFINSQAFDAITVSGWSNHIHDCSFVGDAGGGAVGLRGIDISGGADTYIHNCRFFHYVDFGVRVTTNQRFVMHDCLFIVPNDAFLYSKFYVLS